MTEDAVRTAAGSSVRPPSPSARSRLSAEIQSEDEQLLLANRSPSRQQVAVVITLALLLLLAFLATLPFRAMAVGPIVSFIPVVNTMLFLGDMLTATLLFGQAAVLRSRAFVALGSGYVFTAFIIVPHALTFPGAFSPDGLLGAGLSTTIWLYCFWHIGLPLAVIGYACLKQYDRARPLQLGSVQRLIVAGTSGAALLAFALTLLATLGESWLPAMATDSVTWLPGVSAAAWVLIVLLVIAMAMVARSKRSVLDIWLLLALFAWMIELMLILDTNARFSMGWTTGRIAGLLSSLFVLVMLLWETNKLYARLVLSVLARRRERASRMLTLNAVASSIAHEIKQPLTAISTNAQAGSLMLDLPNPDHPQLQDVMKTISDECFHASEVVDSMRSMLGTRRIDRTSLDINELLRETVGMISAELQAHRVTLRLELDERLPPISVDRVQMQHVFLNLFVNAIEAMAGVADRERILVIRSGRADAGEVEILVEDTGGGIDPAVADRVFEPFFSTKPNGTGMGLSLCRSIVELHGGRLLPTSLPSGGTAFSVRLRDDHARNGRRAE